MSIKIIKISFTLLAIFIYFSVSFSQQNMIHNSTIKPILQVGYSIHIFQDVNIKDAHAVAKVLAEMLVQRKALNIPSKTYIFDDLLQIQDAIKSDKLDVIALTALGYLELGNKIPIEATLVPKVDDQVNEGEK